MAAHIAHDEDDGGCRLDHVEPIAADVDADVAGEIATGDLEAVRRCVDPGEHCLLQAKGGTSLTLVLGKTGDHRCRPLGNPVEARPIDHVALVGAEVADGDTSDRHAIDPRHRDSNLDGDVGICRRFGVDVDTRSERSERRIPQGHLGGSVTGHSSCADGDCVEQERKRSLRVRRRAECIDERRVESLLGETHPLRNNLGGDISLRCHIVGGDTVIVEHRVDAPCDMERLAVGAIVDRLAAEGPSGGQIVSESIEDAAVGERPLHNPWGSADHIGAVAAGHLAVCRIDVHDRGAGCIKIGGGDADGRTGLLECRNEHARECVAVGDGVDLEQRSSVGAHSPPSLVERARTCPARKVRRLCLTLLWLVNNPSDGASPGTVQPSLIQEKIAIEMKATT